MTPTQRSAPEGRRWRNRPVRTHTRALAGLVWAMVAAAACSSADSAEREPSSNRDAPRTGTDSVGASADPAPGASAEPAPEAAATADLPETLDLQDDDEELVDIDPPPTAVDPSRVPPSVATVVASPGRTYPAGSFRRFLLGDLNRRAWEIPFEVEVLDLDSVGGGLVPEETTGGAQTLGLRFEAANGRTYQFRSIVKDWSGLLPSALERGPVESGFDDQMASQFPLAAMVVAELLESADVLTVHPRPVVMPDDPQLGDYRETFAGVMGWIEEWPNEVGDNRAGFAGSTKIVSTEELYQELHEEDPSSYVNQEAFLRARLIDMLVNDWDRHAENWRWAWFQDEGRHVWEPIPRDRDWALARIDGLVPWVAKLYYPQYVGFGPRYPPVSRLSWASQELDRRLLNRLTQEDFRRVAEGLTRALDDGVLEGAVSVLPEPYLEEVGGRLLSDLQSRRDLLVEVAEAFYRHLAGWIDVRATELDDRLVLEQVGQDSVRVRVLSGPDGFTSFDRIASRPLTDEVRVYMLGGDDLVERSTDADLPVDVKVVGGAGEDGLVVGGEEWPIEGEPFTRAGVEIWDTEPREALIEVGQDGQSTEGAEEDDEEAGDDTPAVWDRRDWGHQWIPLPAFSYTSEFGLHLGMSIARRGFGFGMDPYSNYFELNALGALNPSRVVLRGRFEKLIARSGWYFESEGRVLTQRLTSFYGFGNETEAARTSDAYQARRSLADLDVRVGYRSQEDWWRAWAGPRYRRWGDPADSTARVFELFPVRGAEATTLIGAHAGALIDTRDREQAPRSGARLRAEIEGYPAMEDGGEPWLGVEADARWYVSSDDIPGDPTVSIGLYAQTASVEAPYFERASLGGEKSLLGYSTGRFRGDDALAASALLRARLFGLDDALGGLDVGAHGIREIGRVWLAGETSDAWHTGTGYGLWVRSHRLEQTLSVTMVDGEGDLKTYVGLGFPY